MNLGIVIEVDDENPVEGDLRLVDGQLVLVTGIDAIRQELTVRLRWFRGEWFLDRRTGVPWFESILGQKTALSLIERILRRAILATPGVESITRFVLERDNVERSLALTFEARTREGPLEFVDFILPLSLEGGA